MRAGYLSGGEQQMLSIGRGLMSRPKLMLLDEPSLGLAPMLVEEIFRHCPTPQPGGGYDGAPGGAECHHGADDCTMAILWKTVV